MAITRIPVGGPRPTLVLRGPDAREVLGRIGTVLLREVERLDRVSETQGLDTTELNTLVKIMDAGAKFSREMRELDRGDEVAIARAAERLAEDARALADGEER
jgi:hypothetical protein